MDPQSVSLVTSLKHLFGKEDQSNCVIEVFEVVDELSHSSKRKRRSMEEELGSHSNASEAEFLFCKLPAHSYILTLQSEYFRKMYESSMKESQTNKLKLKVGVGEGQYVHLFLKAFYDHDIFEGMEVYTYLRVVEIADRYSCDLVIQQAVAKEKSLIVQNFNACQRVFQRICQRNYGLILTKAAIQSLKAKCILFASMKFCPFEMTLRKDRQCFLQISFQLLISMLKSKQKLAYHEDSILYFLTCWLEHDTYRQTEKIIKALLSNIDYSALSGHFLLDVISQRHSVLNKWPGYLGWFISAIGYHAHFPKRMCISEVASSHQIHINRKSNSQLKPIFFKTDYIRIADGKYEPKQKFFIYHGYEFHQFIEFKNIGNDSFVINFGLEILNLRPDRGRSNELNSFCFAIGFDKGPVDQSVDYSVFETLAHCMVRNITCFSYRKTYCIGATTKSYLEGLENFSIYVTLKDPGEAWKSLSLYDLDPEDSRLTLM